MTFTAHSTVKKSPLQLKSEQALKSPPSSISDGSQHDGESGRGRRQNREDSSGGKDAASGDDNEDGNSPSDNRQHRKRKRSRKGLEKKYNCPHDGCGKSYSRAEHLYRHQLNHTPKQIYRCDFPDCSRTFVRQDLCTRHRDRHTARGSHLQRKDNYLHGIDTAQSQIYPGSTLHEQQPQRFQNILSQSNNTNVNSGPPYLPPPLDIPSVPIRPATSIPLQMSNHARSNSSTPIADHFRSPQAYRSPTSVSTYGPMATLNRSNSDGQYYCESSASGYDSAATTLKNVSISNYDGGQRHSFGNMNSLQFHKPINSSPHPIQPQAQSSTSPTQYRLAPTSSSANNAYQPDYQYPTLAPLNANTYVTMNHSSPTASNHSYNHLSGSLSNHRTQNSMGGPVDSPMLDGSVPIFGGEGYSPPAFSVADEFTAWLFNDPNFSNVAQTNYHRGSMSLESTAFAESAQHRPINGLPMPAMPPQHPMSVTSILDTAVPQETALGDDKRKELLHLIDERFVENDQAPVTPYKSTLLDCDRNDDRHPISLKMMQTYIGSYWWHFHPQMPILHKPTFSADKAQNLLLIAIMAIGASCLDKSHGTEICENGAALATFLAWHLRGEIFSDEAFRPPAKLWVFQALLLLEVYEKMYSTRVLHERATIHHATTLTLMRRGGSLRGRSALDSPPSFGSEKTLKYAGSPPRAIVDTPDAWWNHWITNEATRRVAVAAFVIDSTHATMFGHAATMLAHEMQLPLPCDESLWSATSGVEVGKLEGSLDSEGIKPIRFLDGLKRTMSGHPVRTNSLGRTALMAGLLSVSWHMNQRDMQIRSLGVIGSKDLWRGTLTKAFDIWEHDFDLSSHHSLSKDHHNRHSSRSPSSNSNSTSNGQSPIPAKLDEENIFESRTVLHHLAHMAMHVDIVQCQIFARATRLLGRTITPADYNSAQRKIREIWAPRPSARDATFYALRFLRQVLMPNLQSPVYAPQAMIGMSSTGEYSARDDYLLNRPWVLYFAALIVWSYGFALDGAIWNPPSLLSREQQKQDMRDFLMRVGGVRAPEDLENVTKRNECLGLLLLLRDEFKECRWELMHEASSLLNNCIGMLQGRSQMVG